MAHQAPITRVSGAWTPLQHPTPEHYCLTRRSISSTHASFASSLVQRLEGSAEEMSAGGSDIAEEIRRMNQEQKEKSRQNSVQSSHNGERDAVKAGRISSAAENTRSRASSQSTGILNSLDGFMSSPIGSLHSHSSQRKPIAGPRRVSGAGSSRLAQMVEPTKEGRPLDLPLLLSNATSPNPPSRHASQSSFARRYDQIASQIEQSLQDVPPSPPKHDLVPEVQAALWQLEGVDPAISRSRSMDTFQEIQQAFKDFDGVHYNQDTDQLIELDQYGNEVRRVSAHSSAGGFSLEAASMLRQPRDFSNPGPGAPPPAEGMVYYPAPVPRMLNLPKRLSQMPASDVVAKRRTQLLSQYPSDVRASAPWLAESSIDVSDRCSQLSGSASASHSNAPRGMINERMSVANYSNVPPQLRASVFFDHQSVVQNVEIKRHSAMATLDSILAASATAPVNAFLDHPYAGDVRKSVFAPEVKKPAQRRSTSFATAVLDESKKRMSKKRSSSIGRLFRRSLINDLDVENDGLKLARRESKLTVGDDLARPPTPCDELASMSGGLGGPRPDTVLSGRQMTEAEQIDHDFEQEEQQENVHDEDDDSGGENTFVQPATLLAELQVRKAQQKSRNKTAATAFPHGMHSTLLEMDAVEEISRRKRRQHRPTLAWEDPALREHDDDEDNEDVPLGMLFPSKDGATTRKTGDLRDWDRPLGLMEKRHLEDHEPLSSRRNRLRGISPNKARAIASANPRATQAQFEDDPEDEHAGETLGQRSRRLKTKSALDSAISDVAPADGERPVSTFTDDVLSQFGGLDVKEPAIQEPADLDNETLGQRKARLQREAAAAGNAKPAVKSRASFGTLLSQNPTGLRQSSREHKIAEGTLLHADQIARNKQKEDLFSSNFRASRFDSNNPLVDGRPALNHQPSSTGLLGQQGNAAAFHGGFAGGKYNNGAGGVFASPSQSSTPYFASPTAPIQQQAMFNPAAYQTVNGGRMSMFGMPGVYPQQYGAQQQTIPYGMPTPMPMPMNMNMNMNMGMNMGIGMGMNMGSNMGANMPVGGGMQYDPNMDHKQREMIDRWRMAVP